MIEFIEFNENKTGIKFISRFDKDKIVTLSISDGYTGLNLWKDRIVIKPNIIYFFNAKIFSKERNFEIYDEYEDEKLFSIFINLDGYPSIREEDKLNILKSYNYDYKEEGVGLPVFEIFLNKTYENEDIQIKENDIVFDIGGNIGIFTYYAICKDAKEVHVFEPGKKEYNSIKNNIINNFNNVYGNNCAVDKNKGPIKFYINDNSSVRNSTTNNSDTFYEVNAINLEEYTEENNIKQIDFLKIDCEGCEYEMIKYLSDDFLRTKINKIVMEFHKDLNSTETLLLLSKLEKNGFINTVKGDIIFSINKNK